MTINVTQISQEIPVLVHCGHKLHMGTGCKLNDRNWQISQDNLSSWWASSPLFAGRLF